MGNVRVRSKIEVYNDKKAQIAETKRIIEAVRESDGQSISPGFGAARCHYMEMDKPSVEVPAWLVVRIRRNVEDGKLLISYLHRVLAQLQGEADIARDEAKAEAKEILAGLRAETGE